MLEGLEWLLDAVEEEARRVLAAGAEYADARVVVRRYRSVTYDKDGLRDASSSSSSGIGVRVVYRGFQGYSSTTRPERSHIRRAFEEALQAARGLAAVRGGEGPGLAPSRPARATAESSWSRDPFSVDPSSYVELARAAVEAALGVEGVQSAYSSVAAERVERAVVSSDGARILVGVTGVGLLAGAVARGRSGLERVGDRDARVAGWEYLERADPEGLAREVAGLAVEASNARPPRAGRYRVVLDPEVVGLLVHEALGHASEADLVLAGSSILAGRVGERIGSELVTIVDEGVHPTGYYVPYDDEGTPKGGTLIIERGVLRGFLAGRSEAHRLGQDPTGNARAMDHHSPLLVRMTNTYMLPGDARLEELLEMLGDGLLLTAKGAGGGETDPGTGTFTFQVGVSYRVERGRIVETLRGASISGQILEVLHNVEALGREARVRSGVVFGGCGKSGQLVRVGDGGPHALVRELSVGGR